MSKGAFFVILVDKIDPKMLKYGKSVPKLRPEERCRRATDLGQVQVLQSDEAGALRQLLQ